MIYIKHDFRNDFRAFDAIIVWRDHTYRSKITRISKRNYITGMLKLVEEDIINPALSLIEINENWLGSAKRSIDNFKDWSNKTKHCRKKQLRDFYEISKKINNNISNECKIILHDRIPSHVEMKHILSSIEEKSLSKNIDILSLLHEIKSINLRDYIIVCLILFTFHTLKEILYLRKEDLKGCQINFKNDVKIIPEPLSKLVIDMCNNSSEHLFSTAYKKKMHPTQIVRNVKKAGKIMGLKYNLTPTILHGYANIYLSTEIKQKILESM